MCGYRANCYLVPSSHLFFAFAVRTDFRVPNTVILDLCCARASQSIFAVCGSWKECRIFLCAHLNMNVDQ